MGQNMRAGEPKLVVGVVRVGWFIGSHFWFETCQLSIKNVTVKMDQNMIWVNPIF